MERDFNDNVSPQSHSPLFSRIPAEIRNQIFHLALEAEDNKEKPYTPYSYYYRPGFQYSQKIHTDLLLTCRRVYLETRFLPLSVNEHTDWFFRAPSGTRQKFLPIPTLKGSHIQRAYENCLNKAQISAIRKVHLFTQQFWLEDAWRNSLGWSIFTQKWSNLTQIKITIRHTDWWNWESNAPLAMDAKRSLKAKPNDWIEASSQFESGSWGHAFRHFQALKVFELELETIERKKNELDKIVAQTPTWQFVLGNGNVMTMDESKTKRTGWVGSKYFTGKPEPPTYNIIRWNSRFPNSRVPTEDLSPSTENAARTRLIAAGVTFDDLSELEASLTPIEKLIYYVVTLTWHASVDRVEPVKDTGSLVFITTLRRNFKI